MSTADEKLQPTVIVIDDDANVREALDGLFRSVGLAARLFESVQDFLDAKVKDSLGCIVLDVRLPGQSGLDFQECLGRSGKHLPIVFISGHADIAMSVRAMKAGAVEFLAKPVRDQDLLDAVQRAVDQDRRQRQDAANNASLRKTFAMLSRREQDVMQHVVTGRLNKQIAADVGLSEATVKLHRGRVMQKMGAKSLVELVRMADRLGGRPS